MSNPPERPWTEEEKYTLLTEILKKAGFPSSHLVKMIRDFNISPNWADIPLPPGRSMNSCQMAFVNMVQHVQASVNPGMGPFPLPRHEASLPPAPSFEGGNVRKRPLFPADKPMRAPRAIQPRPAGASTASLSSESGASALVSPGAESVAARGEPPRKRGRPSKAESERRKAAAEARGETYPPPRRSGSSKIKIPSAPTSPAGVEPFAATFTPQATASRPPHIPQPNLRYAPPIARTMGFIGPGDDDRLRDPANRDIDPALRELPRPTEMRQTLPSPQALQLGHRETMARVNPVERPFERPHPDRVPFADRRALLHPPSRHHDEPSVSSPEMSMRPSSEKRTE
ncbi:hypothetical protein P170DRAFT_348341 [Aspergillus steynii IBT 23096]|uniref:Myb-like domain-containing protein n=1 Tax=Aspergillus steynii IBT 23096 TaxID=1392250 RepID=A0A2I2GG13_9EURO|nr:uncharacterized protein P170DRAFT_348341 [Aspergillus steynii IBT 23096]PLB51823.1 hypothetical protein P170DRAFT_348341 [Aspergillus steynii IBT 23096]